MKETEQERLMRRFDNYIDQSQQWLDLTPNQRIWESFKLVFIVGALLGSLIILEVVFLLLVK